MIDNTTQWTIWCFGWGCMVGAAYLQAGKAAALATLGAGLLRASGLSSDPIKEFIVGLLAKVKS